MIRYRVLEVKIPPPRSDGLCYDGCPMQVPIYAGRLNCGYYCQGDFGRIINQRTYELPRGRMASYHDLVPGPGCPWYRRGENEE